MLALSFPGGGMSMRRRKPAIHLVQVASVFSLTLMLTMNALSTTVPLNGRTAGQISNRFKNLMVPDGMIFSIWAVVYTLLLLYVIYIQMRLHRSPPEAQKTATRQGWLFALSGVLNSAWILSWHYYQLRLSMGIILALLVILVMIYADIPGDLPGHERWLKRLPFSIYTAWISFCLTVNAAALLSGLGWHGGALGEVFWVLLLFGGLTALGWLMLIRQRDIGFALTLGWGILGILMNHLFLLKSAHPTVIKGAAAALAILTIGIIWTFGQLFWSQLRKRMGKTIISRENHPQ